MCLQGLYHVGFFFYLRKLNTLHKKVSPCSQPLNYDHTQAHACLHAAAPLLVAIYLCMHFNFQQGEAARDILVTLEKWLFLGDMPKLLLSINQAKIDEAISFIEDVIDKIDDHNEAVNPCKDIITVSKARYGECFPQSAEVRDASATLTETVRNPLFHQIPQLLRKATDKNPVIITSVRKSTTTGRLQFGKQYIVDSTDKEAVRIHYEHEGNGDLPIPSGVVDNLFMLLSVLSKHKREIEQEMAEVCQR